jgi:hypothetical protein
LVVQTAEAVDEMVMRSVMTASHEPSAYLYPIGGVNVTESLVVSLFQRPTTEITEPTHWISRQRPQRPARIGADLSTASAVDMADGRWLTAKRRRISHQPSAFGIRHQGFCHRQQPAQ